MPLEERKRWIIFVTSRNIQISLLTKGAFVWDQSGIRITGILQVSVCLGAILIPEYLDSILGILLPDSQNIFRNTFLFRNIPKRTRPYFLMNLWKVLHDVLFWSRGTRKCLLFADDFKDKACELLLISSWLYCHYPQVCVPAFLF